MRLRVQGRVERLWIVKYNIKTIKLNNAASKTSSLTQT